MSARLHHNTYLKTNTMLTYCTGILLWSVTLIAQQQVLLGSVLFAVLVNMKHLYASLGPVYAVYLLRNQSR